MRTHRDIIKDAGGATKVASLLGIEANTVHAWVRSDSIPAGYWKALTGAEQATFDELSAAAEEKLRQKGLAPAAAGSEAA